MTTQAFDPEALIDAMAALLDLPIDPAYRPGIVANIEIARGFAELVTTLDLGDHAEPAPVFGP